MISQEDGRYGDSISLYENVEEDIAEDPIREVEELVSEGKLSEAFFMTRRMAAQGEKVLLRLIKSYGRKWREHDVRIVLDLFQQG